MENMIYIGIGIIFLIIGLIMIFIKDKSKKEVIKEEFKEENDKIEEEPLLKKKAIVMENKEN